MYWLKKLCIKVIFSRYLMFHHSVCCFNCEYACAHTHTLHLIFRHFQLATHPLCVLWFCSCLLFSDYHDCEGGCNQINASLQSMLLLHIHLGYVFTRVMLNDDSTSLGKTVCINYINSYCSVPLPSFSNIPF